MTTPSHTAARERLERDLDLDNTYGITPFNADLRLLLDRLDALASQNATLAERNATLVEDAGRLREALEEVVALYERGADFYLPYDEATARLARSRTALALAKDPH